MMGFLAIQQLQVQGAPGLIRKCLKKLTCQAEPKGAGHVLRAIHAADSSHGQAVHSPPDERRATAEIHHRPRKGLVHRHVSLSRPGIARVKPGPIAANPALVAERLPERLTEGQSTIFNRVMGIDLQIAPASQFQIDDRMSREEREHVIEKGDARPYGGTTLPVDGQIDDNIGLLGTSADPAPA